jgi:hypothetical protein
VRQKKWRGHTRLWRTSNVIKGALSLLFTRKERTADRWQRLWNTRSARTVKDYEDKTPPQCGPLALFVCVYFFIVSRSVQSATRVWVCGLLCSHLWCEWARLNRGNGPLKEFKLNIFRCKVLPGAIWNLILLEYEFVQCCNVSDNFNCFFTVFDVRYANGTV